MEEIIKKEMCKWLRCKETVSFDPDTDSNKQLSYGQENTLVMEAIIKEKENIVHYLLEHGASVLKPNKLGVGPLEYALIHDAGTSIVTMLLDYGKDDNKEMIEKTNVNQDGIPPSLFVFLLEQMIARKIKVSFVTISSFRDASMHMKNPAQKDHILQLISQLPL